MNHSVPISMRKSPLFRGSKASSLIVPAIMLSTFAAVLWIVPETEAAVIGNGIVKVGVGSGYGAMGSGPDAPSTGTGSTTVVLRDQATGYEGAVQSNAYSVGWGISHDGTASGYCGNPPPCPGGSITSGTYSGTASTAVQQDIEAGAGRPLRVTHDFHPHPTEANVYEVNVTITNVDSVSHSAVTYRRSMDWRIEPTPQNEVVTIQGITPIPAPVTFFGDSGTGPYNPLSAAGTAGCPVTAYFLDCGPGDKGFTFDFDFGTFAPGQTKEFCMYYGVAPSEADANASMASIGIEIYSLAKPTDSMLSDSGLGTPVTFFVGFACMTPPVADFAFDPVPACAFGPRYSDGSTVTFTDLSLVASVGSTSPVSSTWDFGDGNGTMTSWNPSVTHAYENAGTYTVTLGVVDHHGMVATISKTLNVVDCSPPNGPPTIETPPDCVKGGVGENILFRVLASDPDTWPDPVDYFIVDLEAVDLPENAVFEARSDLGSVAQWFSWRPTLAGTYSILFQASDSYWPVPLRSTAAVCVLVEPPLPAPPPIPAPHQSDADGDGVPDQHDPCPAVAGAGGCPAEIEEDIGPGLPASGPDEQDQITVCHVTEVLPADVGAMPEGRVAVITWGPPATCVLDRFLVWNGTQGDLIAEVRFDPERTGYEVRDKEPWERPHRYYIQAEPAPGANVFVYPRAVPTGVIAFDECSGCDDVVPDGRPEEATPPLDGRSSGFLGDAARLLPWLLAFFVVPSVVWAWRLRRTLPGGRFRRGKKEAAGPPTP